MNTSDFYYELPPGLIAQSPIQERAQSRLLALNKRTGAIEHTHFEHIPGYLNRGDCLVLNDTKVIPARLLGARQPSGGKVEVFLLERKDEHTWQALVKPGRKARPGDEVVFGGGDLTARIVSVAEDGKRLVRFAYQGVFEEILDRLGEMPLPPYITAKLTDKSRYQTVYARHEGSVAAPTAGLHFTEALLANLEKNGVKLARVTLHVGLGTFRPVRVKSVAAHHMHAEWLSVSEEQAGLINAARQNGGRVVAVGTTSCRTLESMAGPDGHIRPGAGLTDIFIYPGYKFKATDALITNFHLPESTLIMLVSALAGRENVLRAYREAVERSYRFFSFGDAMLIY